VFVQSYYYYRVVKRAANPIYIKCPAVIAAGGRVAEMTLRGSRPPPEMRVKTTGFKLLMPRSLWKKIIQKSTKSVRNQRGANGTSPLLPWTPDGTGFPA